MKAALEDAKATYRVKSKAPTGVLFYLLGVLFWLERGRHKELSSCFLFRLLGLDSSIQAAAAWLAEMGLEDCLLAELSQGIGEDAKGGGRGEFWSGSKGIPK